MKGLVVLLLLLSTTSALHDDHETSPSPHFGPCHRLNTQTPGTCIDLNNLVCSQTPLIGHCPGPATIRCCQGEITAKSASRASNPHNSASPAQPPALQPREAPQGGEVVPAAGKTGSFPSGGSLTGRAFFKEVCKMSDSALTACAQQVYRPTCEGGQAVKFGVEREIAFVRAFLAGNVPAFLNALKPVQLSDASGALKVTVFVTPDVLSVGTNEDYVRLSLSPYAGALIGDKFGMTMPTKAVVQAEYATPGAVKIPAKPLDYKGGQTSCAYLWNTNVYMSGALSGGVGALVAGHRKEPIISAYCAAHDNKLDFYGWYKPEGVPWQTNPAHAALYSDYSHGLRLMSKTAEVTENGETSTRDVWELLRDAKYAAVLNKGGGGAFDAAKCYRDDSHPFKDALYAAFE